MSKNKLGLVVGSFLAIFHLVWSVAVAITPSGVQSFMNWIFNIHHLSLPMAIITPFVVSNAIILIIVTFIMGYIFGWVLAALFNILHKQ